MEVITKKTNRVQPFEILTKKGKGHPDNICDDLAVEISSTLTDHYERDYGTIQPHTIKYINLLEGKVDVDYGNSVLIESPGILIHGQVSSLSQDPNEICGDVVATYFIDNLCSPLIDVTVFCHMNEISPVIQTFFGWGYSTNSVLEKQMISIDEIMEDYDSIIGTDYEIKGYKEGKNSYINLDYAVFCEDIEDEGELLNFNNDLQNYLNKISSSTVTTHPILTALGTRFESASGCMGRGNRYNGFITPLRPSEFYYDAPNKVKEEYNELAFEIAKDITENTGILEVEVFLMSSPSVIFLDVIKGNKQDIPEAEKIAKNLFDENVYSIYEKIYQ